MQKTSIAYLCLEVGIRSKMKNYCGGLGILAGDTLRSAADLGLDMVGVTILYKNGWFKQVLGPEGEQIEEPDVWDWQKYLMPTEVTLALEVGGQTIHLKVWKYEITGLKGDIVPLYFLDADVEENAPELRDISSRLYPRESVMLPRSELNLRLLQEMVIGIGGVQVLQKLGYGIFDNYHINESHAVLAALELYHQLHTFEEVKKRMVFTTHTPLAGAHRKYERGMLEKHLGEYIKYIPDHLFEGPTLNMTTFALFCSKFSNGVSQKHNLVTSEMYPEFQINGITNGIHTGFWTSPFMAEVFTNYISDWKNSPMNLKLAQYIPLGAIALAHDEAKQNLMQLVLERTGKDLDASVFTIGFARRMVGYKRANLILSDYERLLKIAKKYRGLQIVFAGKAYPDDAEGEAMLKDIFQRTQEEDEFLKIALLPDYDIGIAQAMVSGVDLWLNNPILPLEASGTSGMKAALNGVPNYSTLDGWWLEGCVEGVTGWSISNECNEENCPPDKLEGLYDKLDKEIIHIFKHEPETWQKIQRNSISLNGSYFHTARMMMEYYTKAYI